MKKINRIRATAFLCCIVILITALCSCGKTDFTVLRFTAASQAVTFDPQIAADATARMIVRNTFEGLVRPGINGEITPGVAEKWEISADGLTYTFHLRDGVKYHLTDNAADRLEGKLPENFAPSVTANDFVFALRRAVNPITDAPDARLLRCILNAREIMSGKKNPSELGVTAPDERTLVITLCEPNELFLQTLCEPLCMPCNETFFNACGGRYGLLIAYSLSNGPFYLSFFDETTYRLRKSTSYSGIHASAADTLWFYYRPDTDGTVQKLSDGDYSGADLTAKQAEKLAKSKKNTVIRVDDTNRVFLLNRKNEKLSVKELRDAFMYATNGEALAKDAGETAAVFPVPDVACVPDATAPKQRYDESKVGASLDKALKELDADNITLTVLCEKKDGEVLKRLLQKWQKCFGIRLEIKLEEVETQTLLLRVGGDDWEIAFYPLRASSADSEVLFSEYFAENSIPVEAVPEGNVPEGNVPEGTAPVENGQTETGCIPQKLLDEFSSSTGEMRKKLFSEICERLLADGAVLPVWKETSCFVCGEGVHGVYVGAGADRRYFENANTEK